MDFGAGGKLAVFGRPDPTGPAVPVPIERLKARPRGTGPRTEAEKFIDRLAALLARYDVVTESATIGSSGAETALVDRVLADSPGRIFTLPTRAVKNWAKDHGLTDLTMTGDVAGRPSDAQCAEILYRIAASEPSKLREYTGKPDTVSARRFTSVRPADKRSYTGAYAGVDIDDWIGVLPALETLPVLVDARTGARADLPQLLGDGAGAYRRSVVLPFALALSEAGSGDRDGFEHVIGLYAHGYPSFYRRATVDLMLLTAKTAFGRDLNADITKAERKAAWRLTRRTVRYLYAHADRPRASSFGTVTRTEQAVDPRGRAELTDLLAEALREHLTPAGVDLERLADALAESVADWRG